MQVLQHYKHYITIQTNVGCHYRVNNTNKVAKADHNNNNNNTNNTNNNNTFL